MTKKYSPEFINQHAETLAKYSRNKIDMKIVESRKIYTNMGATLADAVLQINANYNQAVEHRIIAIEKNYKEAKNLSGLKKIIKKMGANKFLTWQGYKGGLLNNLIKVLDNNNVETTVDLKNKMCDESFKKKILNIHGIGPKTTHYIGCMVGLDWVAIDRRLIRFSLKAGLPEMSNRALQKVIEQAADKLKISRRGYDLWIWEYMAGKSSKKPCK